MPVERSPSSHGRLAVRDGPDELPSSLIISLDILVVVIEPVVVLLLCVPKDFFGCVQDG